MATTPALDTKRASAIEGAAAGSVAAHAAALNAASKTEGVAPTSSATGVSINAKNVASPGELCGFVDTLLTTLESRFDEMSDQVLSRMNDMAVRIDSLETAIADLMRGEDDPPTPTNKI